jgi:cyclopropane fatty-acyl-phospholipid synthase-like methyltransferase
VHWGYWPEPSQATGTAEDYGRAAEALCRHVCAPAMIEDGQAVLDAGCGFGGTIA